MMFRLLIFIPIFTLAGCSSVISGYIASQQSFAYEQIASKKALSEQGFSESVFCSPRTGWCISYLTAKPLSDKEKLRYRVEIEVNDRVELNELDVHREDVSSRSGLVVLVHGFRASKEFMVNSALYFRFLGFDVLLTDLLGHGRSSPGIRFGVEDSIVISELIDDLDYSGDNILLVGNSLGAVAAMQLSELRGDVGGVLLQAPMIRFDQAAVNYIDAYSPFLSSLLPKGAVEEGAIKALRGAGVQLQQTDIVPMLAESNVPTLVLVSNLDPVAPPGRYRDIANDYISVVEVSERSHPSMAVITQEDSEVVQSWLANEARGRF